MENPVFDESTNITILNQVHEGMRVCDSTGQAIGGVQQVFLGAISDETTNKRGRDPATASDQEWRNETLVDDLAEAFSADEPMPEAVRGRLFRIDTSGLFASDRHALVEHTIANTGR